MSRRYELTIVVKGFEPENMYAIRGACLDLWPFEAKDYTGVRDGKDSYLRIVAVNYLSPEYSIETFTYRLAQAIWAANGRKYCKVEFTSVYLDALPPAERLLYTKDDYNRWSKQL